FVATMEAPQAMTAAAQFLAQRGFVNAAGHGFAVDNEADWNSLEMRRGKKSAVRAKSIAQLPQQVHIHFDRGRVAVALSIQASTVWGGSRFTFTGFGRQPESPKRMRLHTELLTAIATGLEQLLATGQVPGVAMQRWDAIEQEIARLARRRTIRNAIILTCFVLICVGLIMLAVF